MQNQTRIKIAMKAKPKLSKRKKKIKFNGSPKKGSTCFVDIIDRPESDRQIW